MFLLSREWGCNFRQYGILHNAEVHSHTPTHQSKRNPPLSLPHILVSDRGVVTTFFNSLASSSSSPPLCLWVCMFVRILCVQALFYHSTNLEYRGQVSGPVLSFNIPTFPYILGIDLKSPDMHNKCLSLLRHLIQCYHTIFLSLNKFYTDFLSIINHPEKHHTHVCFNSKAAAGHHTTVLMSTAVSSGPSAFLGFLVKNSPLVISQDYSFSIDIWLYPHEIIKFIREQVVSYSLLLILAQNT